jgi:nucleotide-binding universal stress UspA family protein
MPGNILTTAPVLFPGGDSLRPEPPLFREILFPSDLSPASGRAFDHARLLAERFGAHLIVYHTLEPLAADRVEREVQHRLARAAREHIDRSLQGVSTRVDVRLERVDSARRGLVEFIRATRPDLVVMSTHGRSGLAHFVLGSVTEEVLQHTGAPILCVREPAHGVALPYRRILLPTDLRPESQRAFPVAGGLARAFDAEVVAVHVADVRLTGPTWGVTDAVEDRVPSEGRLASFVGASMEGVRVRTLVELGSACDVIVQVAAAERADLVVLSTHGEHGVLERLLGSQAERIVRQAPCPVLVV